MTQADKDHIDEHYCEPVWAAVFALLDGEPDIPGEVATKAAGAAERAVRKVLTEYEEAKP